MKIRFQSRGGQQSVVIPALLGNAVGRWHNGEVKDVADDLIVRVMPRPGAAITQAKAIDAILLAGPDFVDDATGTNPDYTCAVCKRETLSQFWYDNTKPDGTDKRVRYENAAGEPLCERDYLLEQEPHSSARRYHAAVEHSTGHRELLEHLAANPEKRADGDPVVVPPPIAVAPVLEAVASVDEEAH